MGIDPRRPALVRPPQGLRWRFTSPSAAAAAQGHVGRFVAEGLPAASNFVLGFGLDRRPNRLTLDRELSPPHSHPHPHPYPQPPLLLCAEFALCPSLGVQEKEEEEDNEASAAAAAIEEVNGTRTRKGKVLQRRRFGGFKVRNASLRRLLSGAFAGSVSRTALAPLETIRTHLMAGSASGHTVVDVFRNIMDSEGWRGLFRGNGVNVIRVAPSKAIELFAYDTVKNALAAKPGICFPISSVAGATAGVCSTLCTYPLELLKTRMTIQIGVYDNLLDAFVKICKEEGFKELYRGLVPSLIGVIPYAATNYYAYDTMRRLYKKIAKKEEVGNLATLLIGSTAGALASATSFPLEVARKKMQVGAICARSNSQGNLIHVLSGILEEQGPAGLYRGLGLSWLKLIPAAGISFMCYEACKRVLIEDDDDGEP